MKRVEIIFDEANESEILMVLRQLQLENFTRFHNVTGHGSSGAKLGNSVGPGLNSVLVIYTEDDVATQLVAAVRRFKEFSSKDGGHAATRCAVSDITEFV